ncbi:hypothetical protein [Gordonia sp. NPDC003376]
MTSRAEQIRAQASRVASQPSTRSAATAKATSQIAMPAVSRRVGKTVNLDADLNQRVLAWQAEAAHALGVPRVTFQSVVDALLTELLNDDLLARRTREFVAAKCVENES